MTSITTNQAEIKPLSQYANSPKFMALFNGLLDLFNNAKTLEDWYNVVFDIKTATGYGLDIWGKILNVGRSFTYDNNGVQETIYLSGEQTIDGVHYSDYEVEEAYRQVLLLSAMSNITNATLKSLNNLFQFYYQDRGIAYCINYGTMKIRVVYEFYVNKLEQAIFSSSIFPKPTGVLLSFEYVPNGEYFGFYVNGETPLNQPYAPFDNKPFYW